MYGLRKILTTTLVASSKRTVNSNKFLLNYRVGFATTTDDKNAPEEFFDEVVEKDKMYFDAVSVLTSSGLEKMTVAKSKSTWGDVEDPVSQGRKIEFPRAYEEEYKKAREEMEQFNVAARAQEANPVAFDDDSEFTLDESQLFDDLFEERSEDEDGKSIQYDLAHPDQAPKDPRTFSGIVEPLMSTPDLAHHLKQYEDVPFLPAGNISFTQPQHFEYSQYPNPRNIPFLAKTDPDKYRFDQKGLRACDGKRQRRGKKGLLKCHLVDLDELDFMDVQELKRFQTEHGEIGRRKDTGLCSKCQRTIAKHIKRARAFGFLPHLGNFGIRDVNPVNHKFDSEPYHAVVPNSSYVVSNSIIK